LTIRKATEKTHGRLSEEPN